MTNAIAIGLGGLILGFLALDHFVLQWGVPLIAMRGLVDLLGIMAFWR